MLIKQIFELRKPGSPCRVCTPITGCFQDKTIISKENIRLDCYLLLKYCRRQSTLLPPTWAKSLTKFNPKMQNFKRVLNLDIARKRRTEQLNFLTWLSNVKNVVLSNGYEYKRNVIQWYQNSFFSKNLRKIAQRLEVSPVDPRL